ncbi:MAG TPA: tetratricopeptide repeat protein [Planctomycetaceae bacterium]|nr:tetratricopeptide repeat protein [Planctomycetaceae bacterium]
MNKMLFRLAFVACLAATGCASPMRLFSKKPQPFDEYLAQRKAADQARVPSSNSLPQGPAEISELLNKGHASFQQGAMMEAQASYQAVVQRQPNHPLANHRLAVIADRQQDFATAERYYLAALAAAPRDANVLNDLGYSYLLQSRYAEAERYLNAALQQNSMQANAINNLGVLYAKQGQSDRALAMFRRTSSEAEAQAKLARVLPAAAAQTGTMLAYTTGLTPQTAPGNNGSQWLNNAVVPPNGVNLAWQQTPSPPPLSSSPDPTSAFAQAAPNIVSSAFDDPNISEPARRLKEEMERKRQEATTARLARDEAERQRQAALMRQLRDEELGRSNVVPAGGSPSYANVAPIQGQNGYGSNGFSVPQAGVPPQSGVPSMNAPQTGAYSPSTATGGFPAAPNRPTTDQNASQIWAVPYPPQPVPPGGLAAVTMPGGMPNRRDLGLYADPSSPPTTLPNGQSNLPNATRGNSGSPLDAMPTWPPPETLSTINSNATTPFSGVSSFTPNAGWPNRARPNAADEAARAASRFGMNAGPGNLFPVSPGPSNSTGIAPNGFSTPHNFEPQNNNVPQDGVAPQNPASWPSYPANGAVPQTPATGFGPNPNMTAPNGSNFNRQSFDGARGEPPAGSFGPGDINTSANWPQTMSESPAQFALQGQLPPSEQYQTPTPFGLRGSQNRASSQPSSFVPNRTAPRNNSGPNTRELIAEMERASARSTAPDRAGGDNRWEQGSAPNSLNPNASVVTMQGFLATPTGDNALAEYERMNQQQNQETYLIRQQLDAQRQLPGSENYFRSSTQPQLGVQR